jgi:hypothetical protein
MNHHARNRPLSRFLVPQALFPPRHTCKNDRCPRALKGQLLTKAEQRDAVLYTLDHGPVMTKHVHLQCECECYLLSPADSADWDCQTARLRMS